MKRFTYLIAILLLSANSFAQGHFVVNFHGLGQDHMTIYVVNATIGGVALEAGDEIAAFDGLICCGKAILKQPIDITKKSTFSIVAASKADDELANGYSVGDAITIKFWDSSNNKEITGITAEYIDPVTGLPTSAPLYTANVSAFVKLSVDAMVNQTPTSNAGLDQTVNEGATVLLDGSASSDPDGNPLTYKWTAPAGISLSSTTDSKPTFTAPEVTVNTSYTISLVVNDGLVDSPSNQVVITVKNGTNGIPVSNAGLDQTVNEGATVLLDGSASSDPDGNPLTYKWTAPAGISLSSATDQKPTFTAPEVTVNTSYTITLVVNDGQTDSSPDHVVITVKNVINGIPVANAGLDQIVNEGATVLLDGSASSDPDGNPLTYKWTAPAGISLSSATDQKPTFTAPEVTVNTSYTITLVVNDGQTDSSPDHVVITVKNVINGIPVANAGLDQTVNEGATVLLDGSASSDPDGNPLTYKWTAPAGISLSSTTDSKPTFTAPEVTVNTSYTISLVVNDGLVDSPSNQVVITVKNGTNGIPVANAGLDQIVNEGATVLLDGSASSDPDGNPLTYKWTAPAGISLSSATDQKPTFTAPEVTVNTSYTITLVVNDGQTDSSPDHVVITVKNVINGIPVANAGLDQTVNEGATVLLDGSASSDPDGNPLTYKWTAPAGISLSSATDQKPTFTAPEVTVNTSYTITLVVNDGQTDSSPDHVVITVKNVINGIPVANAGLDQTVNEGATVLLDGSASSDPDGNPLTYKWTAPAGISLSSTTDSKPTFSAPGVVTDTDFIFSLVVNDGHTDSPADQVVIKVIQTDQAPVANAGKNQTVNEGDLVTLDASASSSPGNCPINYQWPCPVEMGVNKTYVTRITFTGHEVTPTTDHTITLQIGDSSISADPIGKFQWVIPAGVTLSSKIIAKVTIIAPLNQAEKKCTFSLVVFDGLNSNEPGNGVITYVSVPPTEIPLVATTVISLSITSPKPAPPKDYTFSLLVYDGSGSATPEDGAYVYFKIQPMDLKLGSLTVGSLSIKAPDGPTDPNYDFSLTICSGSDSTIPGNIPLTYRWTAPPGITLSSDTDAKPTFFAPDVDVDTDYTFSLVVNNGRADSPPDLVVITVKHINKAPTANAGIDQSVNKGVSVILDGSASTDPEGDQLTYFWTGPAGIVLSSNADAKPTFIAPNVSTDTEYTFSLVVNDGKIDSPVDLVKIMVRKNNQTPLANVGIDLTVNEGATVLLDGSASSDPDGDALTYKWTAPPGITLSSETNVRPTFTAPEVSADTQYTFSLVVNDGQADSPPDEVVIKVLNVDHAPYLKNAIKNISVNKGAPDQIIDLKTVFADDDFGDILIYSVISNTNDLVVAAKITGTDLILDFSDLNVGSSELVITANSNGKEVNLKFQVEVDIPTGINPTIGDMELLLYPNPTNGEVNLKFSQTPQAGTWITIYNLSGGIIYQTIAEVKEKYLNLTGFPSGIYFMKINQKTYKLIIK